MPAWLEAILVFGGSVLGAIVAVTWFFSGLSKDVERMKEDIGTEGSGMRKMVHGVDKAMAVLQTAFDALVERVESIHGWKHKVGEAYLPRAVDDHERRLGRVEAKVFNGERK